MAPPAMLVTAMPVMNDYRSPMMVDNHRTPVAVNDDDRFFDRSRYLLGPDRARRNRRGVCKTRHHAQSKRDGDGSPLNTF